MRVGLHDYCTDQLLSQKDGVNFAHENIALLLRSNKSSDIKVNFHDFNSLLADHGHARDVLTEVDCVVSNVGPHAHFYFWLRDRFQLNFRIVRDVRTAIWSSYLYQEHLCAPFLRPQDTLMVASNYVWGVYERMFPHLASYPSVLCYPLGIAFPQPRPAPRARWPMTKGDVALGYLGRLSEDKNFPDIVELLIRLNRDAPKGLRYRLIACGEVHSSSCAPERVHQQITARLGEGPWYEYLPPRNHSQIWSLFERFDVLIFPSTSNLETFGRVLIEASYARVPVIAGRHAASPELVDKKGLCNVTYDTGCLLITHFDHSLGRVDVAEMAAIITSGNLEPSLSYEQYAGHPKTFLDILSHPVSVAGRQPHLTQSQADFIRSLEVTMQPVPSLDQARKSIARLSEWFCDLQRKGTPEYNAKINYLRQVTPYPERTERFISKSMATAGDFTNVGGIDIELCHLEHFYPKFKIQAQ
jgi:glycosyltransferase involved in cell wall biosynthesis